jgi:N-acetyl-anhydromuramoyl-L-alanine amidase
MTSNAELAALPDGWLAGVSRLVSPNRGPRPQGVAVDLIVIHSISLPPGQFGLGNVQALFTNQLDWGCDPYFETIRGIEVSSHFYIERTGCIWQFVSTDERAWHAGRSVFRGRDNCNDFSIGIELEGLEGGSFDIRQYEQLADLCCVLRQKYPIEHVVGHEHIAPGRKFDPGCGFDWDQLQRAVGWASRCFPALAAPL